MWQFNGKEYSRREFYRLLVNNGQTKPLSACRENFRKEYASDVNSGKPCYPIYTMPNGMLYAVDLST
jgi:hypothetical protein